MPRLEAANGLALVQDLDGRMRVEWHHRDWFGPVTATVCSQRGAKTCPVIDVRSFEGEDDLGAFSAWRLRFRGMAPRVDLTVRASLQAPRLVFRMEATRRLAALRTLGFGTPSIAWPTLSPRERLAHGLPPDTRAFGYQYSEFALPTYASASFDDFFLLPIAERPAVVQPLMLITTEGRSLLLGPLDSFHEQIIAVPSAGDREPRVRCGWHGDLDAVPAGFSSELAVWAGDEARAVLQSWGDQLLARYDTRRVSRYDDPVLSRLSYWTDNGSAYWYRTEQAQDMTSTLSQAMRAFEEAAIPVHAVELDSWFYPHAETRAVGEDVPEHVPPTGMIAWEPRSDVLPEGIRPLYDRLGRRPLIVHSRHLSSRSPYFGTHAAWFDGERAHPQENHLFESMLQSAAEWGAVQYEQDWLVESFLGVRGLREWPGRARSWQLGLDRAAARHGLSLLWCMATPADFCQTVELSRMSSIRTSGDYRYLIGRETSWAWFLLTNAFARALGLHAFKDVFLSSREGDGWNGDEHAEIESLLAALAAGPVGIGDRAGRSDRALVLRTCRSDGVLLKPDVPVAAISCCLRENPLFSTHPLVGETYSRHAAGLWTYIAAVNVFLGDQPISSYVHLSDLGEAAPAGRVAVYDQRQGSFELLDADGAYALHLQPRELDYRILCPLLPGDIAVFGDVRCYAAASDRRLRVLDAAGDGVSFELLGAMGEDVRIDGWSAGGIAVAESSAPVELRYDHESGRWNVSTYIGSSETPVAVRLRRL